MAGAAKLKVFRTPTGFHDAYVAAPSQKAALEAWGADSNLFASGSAERVEDPELMREPLANPGKVIRRLRGTAAEHVAALAKEAADPATGKRRKSSPSARAATAPKRKSPPKPRPRPDRAALDRAEAALAEAEKRHRDARTGLARRQAELDRERRSLEAEQKREAEKLQRRADEAREKFSREMRAWRED